MYAMSSMPKKLAATVPHDISPAPTGEAVGVMVASASGLPTCPPQEEQKAAPGLTDFPHLEQNIVVTPNVCHKPRRFLASA
jgi:hypothetical protein